MVRRIGTDAADYMVGTPEDDILYGAAGNDRMEGRGGRFDVLYGNKGDDSIDGQAGNDALAGGAGNDRLWGGDGDDRISGEAGADRAYGGTGRDELNLDADRFGADIGWGGDGDDIIYMWEARAQAFGQAGDDRFNFNFGNGGRVTGGEGADTFFLIASPGGRGDLTVTDFALGEDELALSTFDYETGEGQSLAEIIASFDANQDGALSPEDGLRQVQADGDAAWFRQDPASGDVTGLDLRVEEANLRLAGVDFLTA